MPIAVLMPALSPTMKQGNLVKWYKKKGDTVTSGDQLADIETDKATMEVEAVDEGVVAAVLVPEGAADVKVNTPIAVLADEGDSEADLAAFIASQSADGDAAKVVSAPDDAAAASIDEANTSAGQAVAGVDVQSAAAPPPAQAVNNASNVPASASSQIGSASGGLRPSPLARRLAEEKGLDVQTIQGTGPRGRVVRRDIEKALEAGHGKNQAVGARQMTTAATSDAPGFSGFEPPFEAQPLTAMRRVIAQRLWESKHHAPHFYVSVDVNMETVFALRKQLAAADKKVSVNDFVLWATARALALHPTCNSAWAGDSVRVYHQVDLAVAVALPGGLVTPVIRDAAQKSLFALSAEVKSLAGAAKEGRLKPDQFQGGTFTVSNMGMFGVDGFAAIVNPPQAGILAVGAAGEAVVAENGAAVVRRQMNLTLSVDHRVVDGVDAAAFIGTIKRFLEQPALAALEV